MTLEEARTILSITHGASQAEVREAFRVVARAVHPDRHPGVDPDQLRRLGRQFDRAREARDVLLLISPTSATSPASMPAARFSSAPAGTSGPRISDGGTQTTARPQTDRGAGEAPAAPRTRRDSRDQKAHHASSRPSAVPTLRFDEYVRARDAEGFGLGVRTRRYRDMPRLIAWSVVAVAASTVAGAALIVGMA
jgi:hypothetical protein